LAFGLAPLGAGLASVPFTAGVALSRGGARFFFAHFEFSLFRAGLVALHAAPFAWVMAPLVFALLRRRGRVGFRWLAACGALVGGGWFLGLLLVNRLGRDGVRHSIDVFEGSWLLVLEGAWCGLGAATVIWLIAGRAEKDGIDDAPS
jgi:hypothetical protein